MFLNCILDELTIYIQQICRNEKIYLLKAVKNQIYCYFY